MTGIVEKVAAAIDPDDFTSLVEAFRNICAHDARDWGAGRRDAWIYGMVFGWGPDNDSDIDARPEIAAKHGWDAEAMARLDRQHAAFDAIETLVAEVQRLREENAGYASACEFYEAAGNQQVDRAEAAEARNTAATVSLNEIIVEHAAACAPDCTAWDEIEQVVEALGGETATTQTGTVDRPESHAEPRSGGERGNGRVADGDTAESQEAS